MDNIEALIEATHTPYARLKTLRNMEEVDLLLPSRIEQQCRILEDASAAYAKIETAVDELGQELENQHTRLDEGVKKYGK